VIIAKVSIGVCYHPIVVWTGPLGRAYRTQSPPMINDLSERRPRPGPDHPNLGLLARPTPGPSWDGHHPSQTHHPPPRRQTPPATTLLRCNAMPGHCGLSRGGNGAH
jgi:hypothetical protein